MRGVRYARGPSLRLACTHLYFDVVYHLDELAELGGQCSANLLVVLKLDVGSELDKVSELRRQRPGVLVALRGGGEHGGGSQVVYGVRRWP